MFKSRQEKIVRLSHPFMELVSHSFNFVFIVRVMNKITDAIGIVFEIVEFFERPIAEHVHTLRDEGVVRRRFDHRLHGQPLVIVAIPKRAVAPRIEDIAEALVLNAPHRDGIPPCFHVDLREHVITTGLCSTFEQREKRKAVKARRDGQTDGFTNGWEKVNA